MNAKTGTFEFHLPKSEPKKTPLYEKHLQLAGKSRLAEFAGYLMPLWYSSISEEHRAVRQAAGLFDCTHMGVLEVSGPQAEAFLYLVATNDVTTLVNGHAQYSYIADAAGNLLDDIIIYRQASDNFMVVVNAANEPKIKSYLQQLLDGKVVIDTADPAKKLNLKPVIRDLRDVSAGADRRVDIALQGPAATDVLFELIKDKAFCLQVLEMKSFTFIEAKVCGLDLIIARTGYTGAKVCYELFVHPDKAVELWELLFSKGVKHGLKPCGLGSRDSLRVEAGLPLYGHELAGKYDISPFEAGYGWAVKLQKEFFVGKHAFYERAEQQNMKVIRAQMPGEKGVRPVREGDGILDYSGKVVGWVLSCAKAEERQYALCYVRKEQLQTNEMVGIYYLGRNAAQTNEGKKTQVLLDERVKADINGVVVNRFERF